MVCLIVLFLYQFCHFVGVFSLHFCIHFVSKRLVIKGAIKSIKGEFLFFQETKMDVIDDAVVSSLFPFHDPSFVFCPSTGRSGGYFWCGILRCGKWWMLMLVLS